eukprot:CAMPEP_0170406098 /NCGR_PEP_ID=MMETSP0117_2-20130122/27533_1 /TAXON_ID=400756 /ORGANISM="Durinskia baltica, Strain CSIRO CS-38" /LENGTH=148 /DNA_ID=CAMNT_0010663257 /DNA_START=62 /DNA_END=504 /DNA_ORIENTATION=+
MTPELRDARHARHLRHGVAEHGAHGEELGDAADVELVPRLEGLLDLTPLHRGLVLDGVARPLDAPNVVAMRILDRGASAGRRGGERRSRRRERRRRRGPEAVLHLEARRLYARGADDGLDRRPHRHLGGWLHGGAAILLTSGAGAGPA